MKGLVAALAVASCLVARVARADGLVVESIEHGGWDASVAALQTGDETELHVGVRDGNERLACAEYRLELDAVAAGALALGECDADTGRTLVRVVDRSRLYAHGGEVAQPLLLGVTATAVRSGGARGGAGVQLGVDGHCSIEVHPYVVDPETHAHVPVSAPEYGLRVTDASVHVAPADGGWMLIADRGGALSIAYDVVDARGAAIAHQHASLACGAASGSAPVVITREPVVTGVRAEDTRLLLTVGVSVRVVAAHALPPGADGPTSSVVGVETWALGLRVRIFHALYLVAHVAAGGGDIDAESGAVWLSATGGAGLRQRLFDSVFLWGELAFGVLSAERSVGIDGHPWRDSAILDATLGGEVRFGRDEVGREEESAVGLAITTDVLSESQTEVCLYYGFGFV